MKRYLGKIECAAIIVLCILLNINFTSDKDFGEQVLAAEHETAVTTEDGLIVTGENVYVPEEIIKAAEVEDSEPSDAEDDVVAVGEEPSDSLVNGVDISGLTEEYQELFLAAVTYEIPEGIAFANVEESLSVREKANGDSTQIGIMYPNNYCIVNSVEGEWANITTGTVTGYCRVKYLIRDEEAQLLAGELVSCTAKTTANVNIRSTVSTTEDNIITSVTAGNVYQVLNPAVLSEDPDAPVFVEITYNETPAYLAIGKVNVIYSWDAGEAYEVKKKTSNKTEETIAIESASVTDSETVAEEDSNVYDSGVTTTELSDLRSTITEIAQKYVGLKYVYGGSSLTGGCDCSGFVVAVFKAAGATVISDMPRASNAMSKSTLGEKISFSEAKPGDLMFYGSGGKSTVDHVAIYLGGGLIIHESSVEGCVVIEDWNYRDPLVIRSFLD